MWGSLLLFLAAVVGLVFQASIMAVALGKMCHRVGDSLRSRLWCGNQRRRRERLAGVTILRANRLSLCPLLLPKGFFRAAAWGYAWENWLRTIFAINAENRADDAYFLPSA